MRKLIEKFAVWSHERLFSRKPGPKVMNFIKNLTYVAIGIVIAKFLILLFQLITGNIIGPAEYGKYSLVYTVSLFAYIPMAMATTAMVKYTAENKAKEIRRKVISTTFILTFLLTIFSSVILILFANQISSLILISSRAFIAGVLMAAAYTFWVITTKLAQGLEAMKSYSLIYVSRAIITLALALAFYFLISKDTISAVIAFSLGYLLSSFAILPKLKDYFRFKFDSRWAKVLLAFGFFSILASTSSVFLKNIDRLFINAFLSVTEVGIYQAYITATLGIAALYTSIFVTVLFPQSSKMDKIIVWNKLGKAAKLLPLVYIATLLLSIPLILFYGRAYPFNFGYLVALSFAGILIFVQNTLSWFSASYGIKGAMSLAIAAGLNTLLNYLLIPILGIWGAITATIASYILGLIYICITLKKTYIIKNIGSSEAV